MTPRTSVVIPCFKAQADLLQALESIARQTRPVREVIIVDDGSPTPMELPAKWTGPPLHLIRTPNGGIGAARNVGIRHATGSILAFLDADDSWHPNKVQRQEDAFDADPSAAASFTRCARGPGLFGFGPYPPLDVTEDEFLLVLWYGSFFPPSSVAVRRAALDRAGAFRERMGNGEDVELFVRLLSIGRFAQVPEELTYYRVHPQQFTADPIRKVLGFKDARLAMLELHADRLVRCGIPRHRLWDAYRNDVLLVYYRRDFSAARRLLWNYWKDHPADVRVLSYAILTMIPAGVVTRLRGRLLKDCHAGYGTESDAASEHGWRRAVVDLKQRLGIAIRE